MSETQSATPRQARWMGAIAAAIGLYFSLVGLGVLPIPGGPRNLHAPLWIVLMVGLIFCLAGTAVLLQVIGRANAGGDLPADAPFWIRAALSITHLRTDQPAPIAFRRFRCWSA
jgi:hypothetical protein